jgi:hypothetical protein
MLRIIYPLNYQWPKREMYQLNYLPIFTLYKICKSLLQISAKRTNSGIIILVNFVHVYTLQQPHATDCNS